MNPDYQLESLIMALATPRGRSAIAVVRTSGPGCIEVLAVIFSRPDVLKNSDGHRVHHGWILDGNKARVDEVLLTVFRAPASYTGQDSVEISCHGGLPVVDRLLDVLREAGFRDAAPGEFTFRAFSLGKMDLTRAEAVREIIDSRTDRARALAISRLAGSVKSVIDEVKETVTLQSAVAALALDYPEDEAETVPFNYELIRRSKESLQNLIRSWRTGRLYRDGLKVTLAGPANAGKSSLFNLFLREERSIVTEQPGTTRDWVEAWLNLDGIPLQLMDTAGLRSETVDPIEIEGIRRTRELLTGSDLVVAVADGTAGFKAAAALEKEEMELLPGEKLIKVWNKSDLSPEIPDGWIGVSAVTGEGFTRLEEEIRSRALDGGAPPEADAPVIDSVRQKELLERAVSALECFSDGALNQGVTVDLLAEDLYEALEALGELTGTVTRTDVLNTVFSSFCVGK
ncbi:MAG: tRNA uridine-5-carboxymethylaminomethyl(34) synthesis GTPase MnmE [Spirochaetes bacterium]|nr:MAG: tRNA uridine-5-carboxymethylaminomethyl(34) synthesis GTPase MnmE [Spirochaetota bacterium]